MGKGRLRTPELTIGLDLGDRFSRLCGVDGSGEVVAEGRPTLHTLEAQRGTVSERTPLRTVPSAVAVATSVFVVAITALSAAAGHLFRFVRTGGDVLDTVLSIVVFTAPGVILGAQIGAEVASRIPQRVLERGLGILFVLIAALTLTEAAL